MGKKLFKLFKIIKNGLLDILYEKESICILCRKDEADNVICCSCLKQIVKCSVDDIAYGYYKGQLKELILKFKYERDFNAGELIVQFLLDKVQNRYDDYYITYIPISEKSLKVRGFNQCQYLAYEISFVRGNKVIDVFNRNKNTKIQKNLSKNERIKNMKNAFSIKNRGMVCKKKILVIDDVFTTGATIAEAKRVLEDDGALDVEFLVVARADY